MHILVVDQRTLCPVQPDKVNRTEVAYARTVAKALDRVRSLKSVGESLGELWLGKDAGGHSGLTLLVAQLQDWAQSQCILGISRIYVIDSPEVLITLRPYYGARIVRGLTEAEAAAYFLPPDALAPAA